MPPAAASRTDGGDTGPHGVGPITDADRAPRAPAVRRVDRAARERRDVSIAESEARHRALVEALPGAVLLQDVDGVVLLANPAARALFGLAPDRSGATAGGDGATPDGFGPAPDGFGPAPDGEQAIPAPRRPAADSPPLPGTPLPGTRLRATLLPATETALRTGRPQHASSGPTGPAGPDGRIARLDVTAVPLTRDGGAPHAVLTWLVEAPMPEPPSDPATGDPAAATGTGDSEPGPDPRAGAEPHSDPQDGPEAEQRAARDPQAEALARSQDVFRRAMQHSPIGMAVVALNGRFLAVNRALCRMLGYRADELSERTLYQTLDPRDLAETSLQIGELLRGDRPVVELERRCLGNADMQVWAQLSLTLIRDEQQRPLHFVAQLEDLSDVHRAHQLLTHLTLHDPLTGLPNRTLLLDKIIEAQEVARRAGRQVAVLLADLDHFKVINDSAGHALGDTVLIEVGRRISRALRGAGAVGRVGSDEFVVVSPEIAGPDDAVELAERVRRAVAAPMDIEHRNLQVTASVGIAVQTSSDQDPLSLLRDADIAAHRAKQRGRDRWDVVDEELRIRADERLDLEQDLRSGIEVGDLELHFQPIVDLRHRTVVGREALLRWRHPDRGLLAPGHFLQMAEESGLIDRIGGWVLAEAARVAAASADRTGYVAINVSPSQVTRPGLADAVADALAESSLAPERLVVELTESVMLSSTPGARREIERLDELGVRVVVDDFGTGFGALSYLRDLPVSGIKVDRSFTAGLGVDMHCERIVEALTNLGQGLGVDVIVEGVETEEQSDRLSVIGAAHAQGYLFGRPAPGFD